MEVGLVGEGEGAGVGGWALQLCHCVSLEWEHSRTQAFGLLIAPVT